MKHQVIEKVATLVGNTKILSASLMLPADLLADLFNFFMQINLDVTSNL